MIIKANLLQQKQFLAIFYYCFVIQVAFQSISRILNESNLDIINYNVCSASFGAKGKRNGSTESRETKLQKVNMSNEVEHQDVTLI